MSSALSPLEGKAQSLLLSRWVKAAADADDLDITLNPFMPNTDDPNHSNTASFTEIIDTAISRQLPEEFRGFVVTVCSVNPELVGTRFELIITPKKVDSDPQQINDFREPPPSGGRHIWQPEHVPRPA